MDLDQVELKEKISSILYETLDYAYCDNCDGCDEDTFCNRKGQEWALSKHTADGLAEKIIQLMKTLEIKENRNG